MRDEPRESLSWAGLEYFLDRGSNGEAGAGTMVTAAIIGFYDATAAEVKDLDGERTLELFSAVQDRFNSALDKHKALQKKASAPSDSSPTAASVPVDGGNVAAS